MYNWWVSRVSIHSAQKDFRGDLRPEKRRKTMHVKLFITHSFVPQTMGKLLCSERNPDLSIKPISLYNHCTCMHTNGAIIKN